MPESALQTKLEPPFGNHRLHTLGFSMQGSGKEKTHQHKQICGIVPDWVGAKILFMCFFRVIPYGEKNT